MIPLTSIKELRDKGDLDEQRREDIAHGIEAATAVLQRTNAAIDREERIEAVEELKTLVEDWKGHRIEGFGELLLYGQFTVLKGESVNAKNEEREVGSNFLNDQVLSIAQYRMIDLPFKTIGSFANPTAVQDLPLRNDPAMLQGNQPQEAEKLEQISLQQERKTQVATQRQNLHAECYRNHLTAKAW